MILDTHGHCASVVPQFNTRHNFCKHAGDPKRLSLWLSSASTLISKSKKLRQELPNVSVPMSEREKLRLRLPSATRVSSRKMGKGGGKIIEKIGGYRKCA